MTHEAHARLMRYISNCGLVAVAVVFVWWLARMIGSM